MTQLWSRRDKRGLTGLKGKILALYAGGMTTRDIQAQLQELYSVEVSAGLISNVTNAVEEERKLWQNRLLDALYPIIYFDARARQSPARGTLDTPRSKETGILKTIISVLKA